MLRSRALPLVLVALSIASAALAGERGQTRTRQRTTPRVIANAQRSVNRLAAEAWVDPRMRALVHAVHRGIGERVRKAGGYRKATLDHSDFMIDRWRASLPATEDFPGGSFVAANADTTMGTRYRGVEVGTVVLPEAATTAGRNRGGRRHLSVELGKVGGVKTVVSQDLVPAAYGRAARVESSEERSYDEATGRPGLAPRALVPSSVDPRRALASHIDYLRAVAEHAGPTAREAMREVLRDAEAALARHGRRGEYSARSTRLARGDFDAVSLRLGGSALLSALGDDDGYTTLTLRERGGRVREISVHSGDVVFVTSEVPHRFATGEGTLETKIQSGEATRWPGRAPYRHVSVTRTASAPVAKKEQP